MYFFSLKKFKDYFYVKNSKFKFFQQNLDETNLEKLLIKSCKKLVYDWNL